MHAAAGGVGLILCQWAKHLGATVIGTVGSQDKAELAKKNGCDHVILYKNEDFVAKVKDITGGKMCDVVYDGVGKTTFPGSLDCLKPLGMFVSFGASSGQIDAFNINLLQFKGSLFATRPTLNHYAAKREDLLAIAKDLFDVVGSGAVKIDVAGSYPLKEARKAHEDLEGAQDHRLADPGAVAWPQRRSRSSGAGASRSSGCGGRITATASARRWRRRSSRRSRAPGSLPTSAPASSPAMATCSASAGTIRARGRPMPAGSRSRAPSSTWRRRWRGSASR